jgi:hypothetical protein
VIPNRRKPERNLLFAGHLPESRFLVGFRPLGMEKLEGLMQERLA